MKKECNSYLLADFLRNFDTYVANIGVDNVLLESPAYKSIMNDVAASIKSNYKGREFISTVETFDDNSFVIMSGGSKELTGSVIVGPQKIRICTYYNKDGKDLDIGDYKEFVDVHDIFLENGDISFYELFGSKTRTNEQSGVFDVIGRTFTAHYSRESGVMYAKETLDLIKPVESETIYKNKYDDIINATYTAISHAKPGSMIHKRIYRKRPDVACVLLRDTRDDEFTETFVPLDTKNGLLKMELACDPVTVARIVIPKKTKEEMEEMIQNEKDLKVAEGLRKYAYANEYFCYDTDDDPKFKIIGDIGKKEKSR